MELTLDALREDGWTVGVVERFIKAINIRIDLFGCIDAIAIRAQELVERWTGEGILGIQCTDHTSHSKHVRKALKEKRLVTWLLAGGRYQIWSWGRRGAKNEKKVWTPRIQEITLRDFTTRKK